MCTPVNRCKYCINYGSPCPRGCRGCTTSRTPGSRGGGDPPPDFDFSPRGSPWSWGGTPPPDYDTRGPAPGSPNTGRGRSRLIKLRDKPPRGSTESYPPRVFCLQQVSTEGTDSGTRTPPELGSRSRFPCDPTQHLAECFLRGVLPKPVMCAIALPACPCRP